MALTPSTMLPLGTPLPFGVISAQLASGAAQQVSGEPLHLDGLGQLPLLVLFLCEHCPFVKHVEQELSRLQADVAGPPRRLQILAISSNSVQTHPQDGAEGLRAQAARHGWTFPYLLDGHQEIARAFLVGEPTIGQRIVRAKRTLAEARVPFEVPRGAALHERVHAVLEVIYLVFNEGYSATQVEYRITRWLALLGTVTTIGRGTSCGAT